jgi:DNA-binding transcriptional regulator YhcF (GntR family)
VRSLATGLRVSKNTAHRALSVLREAGLVESIQPRGDDGHSQPAVIGSPSPRT